MNYKNKQFPSFHYFDVVLLEDGYLQYDYPNQRVLCKEEIRTADNEK